MALLDKFLSNTGTSSSTLTSTEPRPIGWPTVSTIPMLSSLYVYQRKKLEERASEAVEEQLAEKDWVELDEDE